MLLCASRCPQDGGCPLQPIAALTGRLDDFPLIIKRKNGGTSGGDDGGGVGGEYDDVTWGRPGI